SRKLRISNAGFPLTKFKSAKESLEANLQVYIDDMRENRSRATLDIIYAHEPMPKRTVIENLMALKAYKFVVGRTRAMQVTSSLIENPHLMISGQTGGGKSTAIRQIITTLYVNQPQTQFLLVDLKGGLEFQIFEGIRGIQVVGSVEQAARELSIMDAILDERMEALKHDGSKDIEQFMSRHRKLANGKTSRRAPLFRIVIVIDEAAEMFLVQDARYAQSIQKARRVLSRIARLGRAVGVHLIVATQRPDKQSLDPQVKANLTGVLCFQMQNDASSISVLGNGRATDLPDIPGRAIWKSGPSMTEVQTPLMDPSEVEETFKSFRATQLAEESIGDVSDSGSPKFKES
ncbi:MAG: AAA family ATPase, partial [Streptococcus sp.]|nr:AAA family ATPase [Streptococcus sp.]